MNKEETVILLIILLSEIIVIVPSLELTSELGCILPLVFLHIVLRPRHVQDWRRHPEDLLIICDQIPLNVMTSTKKSFRSRQTTLKLTSISLK